MKTMMTMMRTMSLVVLIFGTDKVTSKDCCVADQFSVGFAKSVLHIFNSNKSYLARVKGHAAMDYSGHRYAYNLTGDDFGGKRPWKVNLLKFYNRGTLYLIFDDSRCYEYSLREPEPPQCLPERAYLEDSIFFGKSSLPVKSWKMTIHHQDKYHGDLRFATTQANCIPVAFSLMARVKRESGGYDHRVQEGVFFNYTTGLDPSVFKVPDVCKYPTQNLEENTDERVGIFFEEELLPFEELAVYG